MAALPTFLTSRVLSCGTVDLWRWCHTRESRARSRSWCPHGKAQIHSAISPLRHIAAETRALATDLHTRGWVFSRSESSCDRFWQTSLKCYSCGVYIDDGSSLQLHG